MFAAGEAAGTCMCGKRSGLKASTEALQAPKETGWRRSLALSGHPRGRSTPKWTGCFHTVTAQMGEARQVPFGTLAHGV